MISCSYDLHLHSCLSPCGDDDMTPGNIVGMSALKGLQVIALTDHNTCRNCPAAMKHGKDFGVTVLPGMELTTMEEVHMVCLFPTLEAALDFDSYVSRHLIPIPNNEKIFGKQQIMDENDIVIGTLPNLLIGSTDISYNQVSALVCSYGGISYPAHIDKTSTSLLSNLGFIPPDSTFLCAEFHNMSSYHKLKAAHPYLENCNAICCSDAHYLQDIHEANYQLHTESLEPAELLRAIEKRLY
jgi:hypothetical protein